MKNLKIDYFPALSLRRSARSTQVERALRARFHLWIRRLEGSGFAQFNFFTASGAGAVRP